MRTQHYIPILLLLMLSACSPSNMLNRMAPKEDVTLAKAYINDLKELDLNEIKSNLDPTIDTGDVDAGLVKMAAVIPQGNPLNVKLVGVNILRNAGKSIVNLSFEYAYPDNKWIAASVALETLNNKTTIVGLHVYRLKDSLEHMNHFTFVGKSIQQYVVLALAVLIPMFMLIMLILCIKTRGIRLKWLWIIFILFGLGRVMINWTTGQVMFQPISFQLFGAGAFSQFYGPWIVSVSMPLGALVFLIKYCRMKSKAATSSE